MLGNSANGRTLCYTTTTTTTTPQPVISTGTTSNSTANHSTNNHTNLNNNELTIDGRLAPVPCNNFIINKNETCI